MNINEFISRLFERAKAQGLEQCEVYYTTGSEFETGVFKGEIVSYKVSDSVGLSFRALKDGKMGYSATQVLDDEAIDMLVDGVLTSLSLLEDEDEQFLYNGAGEYAAVNCFSEDVEKITVREKIDMALKMEQAALAADPRVEQVTDSEVFTSSGECRIVNTLGLDVSQKDNMLGGFVGPVARDGDQVNNEYGMFFGCDANVDVEQVARETVQDTVSGLNAKSMPSGTYRVVLRNDAAASMLSAFESVFSAAAAQKGLSLLKGREGEVIASDCVTLWDDPHMEGGLASCAFDAEGVPTQKKAVIEAGRFNTLLHNLKTAHKQGVQTTGNASKANYAAQITVAPTNFYFAPGSISRDELLSQAGEGVFITSLAGMHAGVDSISGDFSLSAKGFVIEGGKLGRPVAQITLAGNFYDMLKNVRGFANDLKFGFPSKSWMGSASMLVEKLSVAGE